MTPFQEFRLWLRRAPTGERAGIGVAALVAVAVLVWLLVPGNAPSGGGIVSSGLGTPASGSSASGPAASGSSAYGSSATDGSGTAPGSTATPGGVSSGGVSSGGVSSGGASSGGVSSGGVSTGGSAAGATGGADNGTGPTPAGGTTATTSPSPTPVVAGCPPTPSGIKGITATQIKVGVVLVNLLGATGNAVFGIPSPQIQQSAFQAAIDGVNRSGGVACRKLVPTFYNANPADQNNLQQTCLTIADAGVYAVADAGVYAQYPLEDCYAQHKIAYFGGYLLTEAQRSKFYPYLFGLGTQDTLLQDMVFGLKSRGFYAASNGFKKLGFMYHDCQPQIVTKINNWLSQAGLTGSQIVTFDIGCPALFASSSVLSQAVLKFKQAGVTNVIDAMMIGDFASFTSTAQQQGFHPKYGLPDDSLIAISGGNQHPVFANIGGAVAITASRDGENDTPGSSPTAGTQRCDAAFKADGLPTSYTLPAAAGNACDQIWMLQNAISHAPDLRTTSLAAGLQAARQIDFSYPEGPNDFSAPGTTTGGQYWRAAQFMPPCNCWQLVDKTFHPTITS